MSQQGKIKGRNKGRNIKEGEMIYLRASPLTLNRVNLKPTVFKGFI
jgi:hypothetical protein